MHSVPIYLPPNLVRGDGGGGLIPVNLKGHKLKPSKNKNEIFIARVTVTVMSL